MCEQSDSGSCQSQVHWDSLTLIETGSPLKSVGCLSYDGLLRLLFTSQPCCMRVFPKIHSEEEAR
jgi:hypothetical protein